MIKDRVVQILETKGIAKESFYVKIGMTSASFRGNAKKTPLNSTAIENILSIIPDLNPDWLLTGKGPMLRESSPKEEPLQVPQQPNTEIIQVLLSKIEQQAQEIGKLKERLAVFEEGKGHIEGVGDADVAAVG